jgi:hypothetical protein
MKAPVSGPVRVMVASGDMPAQSPVAGSVGTTVASVRNAPARLVVLVSGSGTNLQALLDACDDPAYGAQVVAVGADRSGIAGLDRADKAGVPTFVCRVRAASQSSRDG